MPEIEFSLRDFGYPLNILGLRREFERTQWFDADQRAAWQRARLRRVLTQAYERVPFYRRVFDERGLRPADFDGPGDLARLPAMSKDAVREHGDSMLAEDAARYRPKRGFTSGTTGLPVGYWLDKNSRILEFVYYWRHWSWVGYRIGSRFAQLNAQHFVKRGEHTRVAQFQRGMNRLMLNSAALSEANVAAYADAMRRRRVRFLKGLASPLYFLALLLRDHGIDDLELDGVFSTGEMLYPARRELIESVFGCKVLDSFGQLEQTVSIAECPRGGYHVIDDYALLELEPTERRAVDGGRLCAGIGTTLHNMAMPLIRYRVGDMFEPLPPDARCPCGRTFPLVEGVHGRAEDVVVTPDGRYVTALFLVPELVSGVRETQFVQEASDKLVANVVPDAGFDDAAEERMVGCMRELVGAEMEVRVRRVSLDDIQRGPTGKVPMVITTVERGRAERAATDEV